VEGGTWGNRSKPFSGGIEMSSKVVSFSLPVFCQVY